LKDEKKNTVRAFAKPNGDAKESITRYELAGKIGYFFLLNVFPLTGRPHQIRVQLASISCPIAGDLKYGALNALPDASIGLHCKSMSLIHPVKLEPILIEAPLPDVAWWKGV
jgi:23S rRNA pseudouridine1911/1915/1917 synthase